MRLRLLSPLLFLGLCASSAACSSTDATNGPPSGSSSSGGGEIPDTGTGGPASSSGGPGDGGAGDTGTDATVKPTTYTHKKLSFDELPSGTDITSQYAAWLTLSTDPGCKISTSSSAGVAASQPNYLWTYYSCTKGDSASFFIDFAKPAQKVSFTLVGVNGASKVATARIVQKDGTKTMKDIVGKGSYATPVVVDVSSFTDVIRLEIVDINDAYGLGLDDLEFDFPDP